ncbi:MliC family protein [Ruegeria sp. NA]|nr:MliC family protein [Ruegeria sp. NA]MCX8952232.1 MliC family protein [Ruegeria sp. NA]
MKVLSKFICAVALIAPATTALAEIDILSVTFTCENGIPLPVTYFNAPDSTGAAATLVDNSLVVMRQVQSGSGIRYESIGDGGTYILRSKGWDASVSYLAAGAAVEQEIYRGCSSR